MCPNVLSQVYPNLVPCAAWNSLLASHGLDQDEQRWKDNDRQDLSCVRVAFIGPLSLHRSLGIVLLQEGLNVMFCLCMSTLLCSCFLPFISQLLTRVSCLVLISRVYWFPLVLGSLVQPLSRSVGFPSAPHSQP